MEPAGSEGETGGRNEQSHQPDRYTKLDERAIAEGWDLTPEQRAEILGRLVQIARYASKNRDATAAARAILQGERLELEKRKAAGDVAGETLAGLAAEAAQRAEQRRAELDAGNAGKPPGAVP